MTARSPVAPWIDYLADVQFRRGLTDKEMAARLHIARHYWNRLRNGRARPGRKVVFHALTAFPAAAALIAAHDAA